MDFDEREFEDERDNPMIEIDNLQIRITKEYCQKRCIAFGLSEEENMTQLRNIIHATILDFQNQGMSVTTESIQHWLNDYLDDELSILGDL